MLRLVRVSARPGVLGRNRLIPLCADTRQLRHSFKAAEQTWDYTRARLFTSLSSLRQSTVSQQISEVAVDTTQASNSAVDSEWVKALPLTCPGCGAYSQIADPELPGFFKRRRVRDIQDRDKREAKIQEDKIFQEALQSGALSANQPRQEHKEEEKEEEEEDRGRRPVTAANTTALICERCRYLAYQSTGTGIIHPSMNSIRQIIEESPHRRNHIYHVLDAADFPMSLIPNLQHSLDLPRLRTQNRRSKKTQFVGGRVAEVTFIITRADLLAPHKEQVDRMLPLLREILRDALGRHARNVRLGNIRCVSAYRGWWTTSVKDEIWKRGGAGWMVGKANVGKSALFEVVFPKGRNEQQDTNIGRIRQKEEQQLLEGLQHASPSPVDEASTLDVATQNGEEDAVQGAATELVTPRSESPYETLQQGETVFPVEESKESHSFTPMATDSVSRLQSAAEQEEDLGEEESVEDLDEDLDMNLLPPAQPETAYPHMPTVSHVAGTTASPIRIPFGNGKGELIDLPGVERSSLVSHIHPERSLQRQTIMKSRMSPAQYSIKPRQSLLLGGMIRITPKTDDLVFLAYPFVPLNPHVTSTSQAIGVQTGNLPNGTRYGGAVQSIATEASKQTVALAGTYKLAWDVTKQRAGPLTSPVAAKLKTENLPFVVYGVDLLIEGVGWVELVCQVRNRRKSLIPQTALNSKGNESATPDFPEFEVWSPEGKFVDIRRPLSAWLVGGPKKVPKKKQRKRPRQTISMQRRREGGARGHSSNL